MTHPESLPDADGAIPVDVPASELVDALIANIRLRDDEEGERYIGALMGTMSYLVTRAKEAESLAAAASAIMERIVERIDEGVRIAVDLKTRTRTEGKFPPKPVAMFSEVATEAAALAGLLASFAAFASVVAAPIEEDLSTLTVEEIRDIWSKRVREMLIQGAGRIGLNPAPVPVSQGLKGRRLAGRLQNKS